MINYKSIQLEKIAIHRVGNKNRQENNFISQSLYQPDADIEKALMKYFLRPIKKAEDLYKFQHHADIYLNEVFNYAKNIFDNPDDLLSISVNILEHLYAQSNHPNIKSGEVYTCYFKDVMLDDELIDAIGIFKSERKNTYFQFSEGHDGLLIRKGEGVNIDKLDKGCLIFNTSQNEGFRVVSVDNNNYDASYWLNNFLNIDHVKDENFHTKSYLELCNTFSNEVIAATDNREEQVRFLNDSVKYFDTHDEFNFEEFKESVIPVESMAEEFTNYQKDFALDQVPQFAISEPALKSARKKISNVIKLDNNVQIRLDFNNPESSRRFIEKGYDEEKGMSFYKVYFNEEME